MHFNGAPPHERKLDRRQFLVIGYWRYGISKPDL